jgi:hypothetical protein
LAVWLLVAAAAVLKQMHLGILHKVDMVQQVAAVVMDKNRQGQDCNGQLAAAVVAAVLEL